MTIRRDLPFTYLMLGPLIAGFLLAAPAAAASSPAVVPTDQCIEIDHSPEQPIGNSPSKAIVYITVPNEFAGAEAFAVLTGASGDIEGVGVVLDDGLTTLELALNSFGRHQLVEGLLTLGGTVVNIVFIDDTFEVDSSEPTCDPSALVRAPVATTTSAITTTTTASSTTTAATTTTTTTTAPITEAVRLPWGWIGLGLGLPLLLFGLWLLAGPGRDCEKLRREWESARSRYDRIKEAFDLARTYLEERRARRAGIEAEIAEMERVGGMGGTVEGGTRFKLIPEGKVTEEGFDQILSGLKAQLDDARQAEGDAGKSLESWRSQLEEAAAKAEAARMAYEDCIRASLAPSGEEATTSGGTLAGATATEPACPEGTREARPLSSPRKLRVYVDFSVIVEVESGSERNIQTGDDLALDLGQLGLDLGALGSLLGARGAGGRVAAGATGLAAGSYVKGGAGIARGTVEGLLGLKGNLGTGTFPVPVPTSPEEVMVGVLQLTAQLGALVAGKVTEWMRMNQIYEVRSTLFYQEVDVQPIQIWECRGRQWVCVQSVLQYEVSNLKRQQGRSRSFRLESDIARHQFQSHIDTLTARARKSIDDATKALVEFEQAQPPGPCS